MTLCNINYYNIYGYKNGTCFSNPLPKYGLIISDNEIYFEKCFKFCKFCSQVTISFLYQQCQECVKMIIY